MERRHVTSGTVWEDRVGYARAIRVGNTIHVSGTVGTDAAGEAAVGDPQAQTRQAIANVADALEEAGASLADVVRTRLYVTDIDDWEVVGTAHAAAFDDIRPATTMVEVSGLIDPDYCVEVEAVAVAGD